MEIGNGWEMKWKMMGNVCPCFFWIGKWLGNGLGNGLEMVWKLSVNGWEIVGKWLGNGGEMVGKWSGNGLQVDKMRSTYTYILI